MRRCQPRETEQANGQSSVRAIGQKMFEELNPPSHGGFIGLLQKYRVKDGISRAGSYFLCSRIRCGARDSACFENGFIQQILHVRVPRSVKVSSLALRSFLKVALTLAWNWALLASACADRRQVKDLHY